MLSLIAPLNYNRFSPLTSAPLNSLPAFAVRLATPGFKHRLAAAKQETLFPGIVRRCTSGRNGDSSALEQEVLEFMLQSQDPDRFPTRKELIEGGRRDLAEAILNSGGWMTRGWDFASDDYDSQKEKAELDVLLSKWNSISSNLDQGQVKRALKINGVDKSEPASTEKGSVNGFAALCNSSHSPAPAAGRSVDTEADEATGIAGILNRLDKQRNWNLGLCRERKANSLFRNKDLHLGGSEAADAEDAGAGLTCDCDNNPVAIQETHDSPMRMTSLKNISNLNGLRTSLKPDTWRAWSIQRAGLTYNDFEAAEINFNHSREVIASDSPTSRLITLHKGDKYEPPETNENLKPGDKYNADKIRSRLRNLELEFASALRMLQSNTADIPPNVLSQDHECPSGDYMDFSDELEFKENEIFSALDKLRSLRARLAVLEGKVALTKIDNQKLRDEKQSMITDSHKALQLLRTTCVIWPNSASEVLLTGSFDGWASQRKMVKSSNGTFSLSLRLYPGRYEFKFIVDGVWKVDPLRPITNNNGNENNLLIIT